MDAVVDLRFAPTILDNLSLKFNLADSLMDKILLQCRAASSSSVFLQFRQISLQFNLGDKAPKVRDGTYRG